MAGIPTIESFRPIADDLPANTAGWRPDAARAVLLVHDMQNFFLRPFTDEHRAHLIDRAGLLRRRCAEHGVPIGYTAQPGDMTPDDRGLLVDFWGAGMKATATDRQVVAPLAPGPRDWTFTKWRYSAFFRSGLLERMRAAGRDQLILCGVYAHIGVLMTAVEAFSNDIETFLVADAVGDFTPRHHRLALEYAANTCAVVLTAEEVFA
ncbi:MAG TPA: isochorismatase family protein [Jatrophihabitans sp.]|nr:isochorismatase family protein [Jatrophihabitans sp.]